MKELDALFPIETDQGRVEVIHPRLDENGRITALVRIVTESGVKEQECDLGSAAIRFAREHRSEL